MNDLKNENAHLKQVVFKLEGDIETARWETANRDLSFLMEIKERLGKYKSKKDITEMEMVDKMINDWIDELKDKV